MKNFFKWFAIIALVATIGFGFIACDDGSTGGGGNEIRLPSAPTNVRAARRASDPTVVDVTWNAVSGANTYKVYSSTLPEVLSVSEGEVSVTSFVSNGNARISTWYFWVTAVNSVGESAKSQYATVAPAAIASVAAPTGLNVTFTSTSMQASWNAVSGAVGYVFYASLSPSFPEELTDYEIVSSTSYSDTFTPAEVPGGTVFYICVTAFNAAYDEGPASAVVKGTVPGGTNYSLDGVWTDTAATVNITGSTGVITQFYSPNWPTLWQDAVTKGFIKVGDLHFRNLSKTGDMTWTGQRLVIGYRTNAPNVATGSSWQNCTITMNANGQTFTESDSSGIFDTWNKGTGPSANTSLDGTWQQGTIWIVNFSGSTGVVTGFGSGHAPFEQDAINKGFMKIGNQHFRNLTKTGDLTWTGQGTLLSFYTSNPSVASGIDWYSCTITIAADGKTFRAYFPAGVDVIYTRLQ